MRTIHLHGHLKKQFGPAHRLEVATAAEAIRALNCAFPHAFISALKKGSYQIVRGDRRNGMKLDLDLVSSLNLGLADLHLVPVAAGAANGKGIAKTIVGVALVGAAIFFAPAGAGLLGGLSSTISIGGTSLGLTYGTLATVGLGMAISGANSLLAGNTTADDKKSENSFNITGGVANGRQGNAIPLIYGEVITTSAVTISFDSDIEDIGAYQGMTGSMGQSVQAVVDQDGQPKFYGDGTQ